MMTKKTSNERTHLSPTPKPGSVEEKMGGVGTMVGRAVDNVAEAPGNMVRSATTIATRTRTKASRAVSKVATRLDPDESKKARSSDEG